MLRPRPDRKPAGGTPHDSRPPPAPPAPPSPPGCPRLTRPAIPGPRPAAAPPRPRPAAPAAACAAACLFVALAGCGKTITREATRQLLTADSIDRAVAEIDLSPFAGRSVYLDTELLEHKKLDGVGVGGQNYLIGSLRQHLMAAGARVEAKAGDADYIVEARAGAVGSDEHEVVYGMPANSLLNAASQVVPEAPPLPSIPEISLAKRAEEHAATKIRLFAYHRQRREIVWQSGVSETESRATHTWLLGAGPFEKGDIYDGPRFAGQPLRLTPKWLRRDEQTPGPAPGAALADYDAPRVYSFDAPAPPAPVADGGTQLAAAEEPAANAANVPAEPILKAKPKTGDAGGGGD